MSNIRVSDLGQISGAINRSKQNVLLDDGENTRRAFLSQILGSGSGVANSLVFKEEVTEITEDMWDDISSGSFNITHAGMHYTAPSGRSYWLADADYFLGAGSTEQTAHHFVVVEDKISHTAQHQTTNVNTGAATSSLIYTSTLPSIQSELEADFGAAHIKTQSLLLANAVSSGVPSGWAWIDKKAFLMNACMVFGHNINFQGAAGDMYNCGNRARQLSLFRAMPETIIARNKETDARAHWWLDDAEGSAFFGFVHGDGALYGAGGASYVGGVRRAFLIG